MTHVACLAGGSQTRRASGRREETEEGRAIFKDPTKTHVQCSFHNLIPTVLFKSRRAAFESVAAHPSSRGEPCASASSAGPLREPGEATARLRTPPSGRLPPAGRSTLPLDFPRPDKGGRRRPRAGRSVQTEETLTSDVAGHLGTGNGGLAPARSPHEARLCAGRRRGPGLGCPRLPGRASGPREQAPVCRARAGRRPHTEGQSQAGQGVRLQ